MMAFETDMRRHRKTLIVVAALLAIGWLAWNLLLVESEVAGVADVADETPGAPAEP